MKHKTTPYRSLILACCLLGGTLATSADPATDASSDVSASASKASSAASSGSKTGDTQAPLEHDVPLEYTEERYIFPMLSPLAVTLFEGQGHVQTGASVYYRDNSRSQDKGVSFGFVQGDYQTKKLHGFSAGGGFLYAPEIWEDQSGDYDDSFDKPAQVRRLYLRYDLPDWENTFVTAGRVGLAKTPITHGDAADGATFSAQGPMPFTITGTAIYRWIHHITSSYDADGISDTLVLEDVYDEAGEVFFNLNVEVPIGSDLKVTPTFAYQENVLAVYGAEGEFTMPLDNEKDGLRWKTKVIGAYHTNEATAAVTAERGFDDNAWSYLVFTGLQNKKGSLGVGYYGVSDDTLDLDPGAFSHFDPLKEDDLFPANDQNDANLFYLKSSYTMGNLELAANFGFGRNSSEATGGTDSFEFDFFATYKFNKNVILDGYFVAVQFEDEAVVGSGNYALGGARLRYLF